MDMCPEQTECVAPGLAVQVAALSAVMAQGLSPDQCNFLANFFQTLGTCLQMMVISVPECSCDSPQP
nr:hypothetical protein [bacterium]